ncbi:MAG: Gfo/Idh/MocA family protein [Spirochaetota bacterium]
MQTYGVGIIGAGFMGKTHTYDYVNMPLYYDGLPFKVRLVGICNRTLSKAERLRDDFGFDFATSDYRDLLERDDIQVIDVCTPNHLHREQIIASLRAGKHVYADKPLCITDREADEIVAEARKTGLVRQVAFHYRFYPWSLKIKMMIDEGFLGRPLSFRVTYYHASNIKTKKHRGWRQNMAESGGGTLFDMGSHALDLIYWFLGEYESMSMDSMILYPRRPDEQGNLVEVTAEDHVLINARMRSGALGTLEISKIIAGSNDDLVIELYGDQGAIRFDSMQSCYVRAYDNREPDSPIGGRRGYTAVETMNKDPESRGNFPGPRFPIGWLRGHLGSQHRFMTCVHEGRQAAPSFEEGAYIQKIMNKLYRVNNRREWVAGD